MTEKKEDIQGKTRIMEHDDFIRESDTQKLKSLIPGKTDAEYGKINRKFLRDAEPFSLGRLINDVKNTPENLETGYRVFDHYFHVPSSAITLIIGGPKQGKSLFMMNLMLNLTRQYRGKHFLYYSYEEGKKDLEIKLINMLSEQPFKIPAGSRPVQARPKTEIQTNLEFWKWKLKTLHEAELLKLAAEDPEYQGLKKFLELSDRIHIIDKNYSLSQLLESIKLFSGPFLVGGVFVDFMHKIQLDTAGEIRGKEERLLEISGRLRQFILEMPFPLILAVPLSSRTAASENGIYSSDSLNALDGLENDASLIIGVQLHKKDPGILLTRVLANRNGIKVETELKFDRQLLKITDPD